MKKNNNKILGITLISLVITIVVLIIIAAIAIGMLTESGVINKANKVKEKHLTSVEEEKSEFAKAENIMANLQSNRDTVNVTNPVGTVISYYGKKAPEGYLLCDGKIYNISDYPTLAALVYDINGNYGTEETNKFAVPDLNEKFLKGSTVAGVEEEAGLPNITGTVGSTNSNGTGWLVDTYNTGAFGIINKNKQYPNASNPNFTNSYPSGIDIDASRSSSVYGKSSTVTPENISILYCIKY